ncbi:MAG TPA: fructosamine kinase family protein [Pseudonocardia sp.]|nr:fructosamine kinase family protein [Pseudonocardia sp.]
MADGRAALVKQVRGQPRQTTAEAVGLRWLAETGSVPIPEVFGSDEDWIVLEYLPPARPDQVSATRFGQRLARLHHAGAPHFGAAPPGGPRDAWIGLAPMRNVAGTRWPAWYAEHRILPYLRTAVDTARLDADRAGWIEAAADALVTTPELAGPPEPPARLHGDLWSGNVCWSGPDADAWLIDPAAHGGHRETDLAMLALFGCPHHDAVLAGYQQVSPLAAGWEDRIGCHQLFPLLVHVVLFGGAYAHQAEMAARSVTRLAGGIT